MPPAGAATIIVDGVLSGPGGSSSARTPRCSTRRFAPGPEVAYDYAELFSGSNRNAATTAPSER